MTGLKVTPSWMTSRAWASGWPSTTSAPATPPSSASGQLPVHEVKIDQSFVTDMLTNDSHDAIVRSTIDLARNLKLRVVAEGVEDRATWSRLGELGCDAGQGFYLSQPLPAPELAAWLRGRQKVHLKVIEPMRRLAR